MRGMKRSGAGGPLFGGDRGGDGGGGHNPSPGCPLLFVHSRERVNSRFQRRQLVECGALLTFLMLVAKDEQLMRSIYQDTAKLYQTIALLLRECDTSACCIPAIPSDDPVEMREQSHTPEMGLQIGHQRNPYALCGSEQLLRLPDEVQFVVYQVSFIEKCVDSFIHRVLNVNCMCGLQILQDVDGHLGGL